MTGYLAAAALTLAEFTGWHLFPTVGKVPATPHGFHDAARDLGTLEALFADHPEADGFAVSCGASGLVVLDSDVKPGLDGRDSLRDAGLPWTAAETVRATTPRGGEHAFFAGHAPSRNGVLPGVDIKADSGYVVLPPAPGRAWEAEASPFDLTPVPAPEWLLALARGRQGASQRRRPTSEWDDLLTAPVPEGWRHDVLLSLAGHLHRRFVDPAVVRAVVESFNVARCHPPQDARDVERLLVDLAEKELRRRGGAA